MSPPGLPTVLGFNLVFVNPHIIVLYELFKLDVMPSASVVSVIRGIAIFNIFLKKRCAPH
jgi:hypothetical protein